MLRGSFLDAKNKEAEWERTKFKLTKKQKKLSDLPELPKLAELPRLPRFFFWLHESRTDEDEEKRFGVFFLSNLNFDSVRGLSQKPGRKKTPVIVIILNKGKN